MNRDRIRQLADHIRSLPPEKFDMSEWFSSSEVPSSPTWINKCGTSACVAGHTVLLFGQHELPIPWSLIVSFAAELLDINVDEIGILFYQVTKSQTEMVKILNFFADGGTVEAYYRKEMLDD